MFWHVYVQTTIELLEGHTNEIKPIKKKIEKKETKIKYTK